MRNRLPRILTLSAVAAVAAAAVLLSTAGPASAQGSGQPVVELAYMGGDNAVTVPTVFKSQKIAGTDTGTRQEYKFQRQRQAADFAYTVANLQPDAPYNIELSFVEHDKSAEGERVFNVYLNQVKVISLLDIYRLVGANEAYQRTFTGSADSNGRIELRLRSNEPGCSGMATISTVRVYQGSVNAVEIDASASRLNMSVPTRFTNGPGQDCYETTLGRMGSRFGLDLLPQKLGARLSSLGDGTGDLSDLVIGLDQGSGLTCLPFTDRYPVWDEMRLTSTMTSQAYECRSAGYRFTVTFTSPFYPGDEKLSGAPFFYVDVAVENLGDSAASPLFVLARPQKQDYESSAVTSFTTPSSTGFQTKTAYTYWDETVNPGKSLQADEALAVPRGEAGDVTFITEEDKFRAFSPTHIWGLASPAGYPRTYSDYRKPIFSFYPRGYTGATWSPTIAPGDTARKQFVMAGYVGSRVLKVANDSYSDSTFKFKYTGSFADVRDVVEYAVSQRNAGDDLEGRSRFFDGVFSSPDYLLLPAQYSDPVKKLIAYSFQSFLMNTWSAVSESVPGREWFSTWEGSSCRFHSTIDMEYNSSWFYFDLWPGKMRLLLEEWPLYPRTCAQGMFLSHDMGIMDQATGQAYPNNMAVEENADYILLLYKYWKTTGDNAFMQSKFPTVRELVDFIVNCDYNGNGLPDLYTGNTLDQSTLALQYGKDQSYLGVKCLAAHQAAREMALSLSSQDIAEKCRAQAESINQTLEQDLWLSDHFAVCFDDDVLREDREAYSIYASNGLGWLASGSRLSGLTAANEDRMRLDIANSAARTLKTYGCTHSSYDSYNEWVSQNIWRDQAAAMLGVSIDSASPLAMSQRYWSLEQYFAKNMWGGYWDVVGYPGTTGGGESERLTPALPRSPTDEPAAGGGAGGGFRRPAESTGSGSYEQFLGYYPRGITSLGFIDAAACLTLDVPDGRVYYRVPSDTPITVPVLSRADWTAADESRRVPTLTFTSPTGAPTVNNGHLLLSLQPNDVTDITDVKTSGHAISPNSDGVNDTATVRYHLPLQAKVDVSIWDGSRLVKTYPPADAAPGDRSFIWDGRDSEGKVVEDGAYTARIDAAPADASRALRPASVVINVNDSVPDLSRDWYLAEGFTGRNGTGGEFEEYITVQNPGAASAHLQVTFMLEGGGTRLLDCHVPASSRFTVTVDDILPDAQVSARVHSDAPVAVERAMYFNGRRAGHDSVGVSSPSKTWYLAEGYTAGSFDEYIVVQNPGDSAAALEATFMTPDAGNAVREYQVPARARFTIHVDDIIPADSVSTEIRSSEPVVVERAQYLNYMKSGTCSIGAVSPSRTWYLAEGYTGGGFETWVVLQNPQPRYNNVSMVFMERDGTNTVKQYLLPPRSRFTVLLNAYLGASEVSVKVRSQEPVLVERAMYWNNRSDGHDCIGTPTPDSEWYLAEGYTGGGFETWVTVQNPGDETRRVTATFMEPGGGNTIRSYEVAPRSRFTVSVNDVLPGAEVSTRVRADGPVIVERSVYFNDRSGGTASVGVRGNQ